ncbi:zinc finger protein Xfin-like [Malaya genurostris]|uniref:zinc finger protein Xfin-like n=1 Tax=Malaya genurostris TaxID=325434 RepID=UPI0026F40218|nr:zinc finger protein Xfin-like [Malaya genurostris]
MDTTETAEDDLQDVPNGDPASYCRLCLSSIDVEALFPDGQGARQDVIDRIHECTGIQITIDEDYASAICWMCSQSLEEFQWFRERCHRYDVLIRRKRKQPKIVAGSAKANVSVPYQVDAEDDNSFDDDVDDEEDQNDSDGPGLLRITSVQEAVDDSMDAQSNESVLAVSSYQADGEDVKPDPDALSAYAEKFRHSNNSSETQDSTTEDAAARRFKCNLCSRSFKNRANLWEHNRLHTGKLPFKCNDCDTTFSRLKSLMAHQEKYHSKTSTEDPPLRLKCKFCPRVFPRKGDRTQHMKMGHPDLYNPSDKVETPSPVTTRSRDTPATTTPTVEKSSPVVRKSVSTSTPAPSPAPETVGAARFCCSMCTKNFQSVQQLEDHIGLMHPKDGILKCSLCPKTFKSKQTLRMHILNHQGKLPYKCDDCGSRFDRRFYLQKHRDKYHDGEDCKAIQCRYRCKFCPRIFHRKIDRKTHIRMVHSKEIKVKKEKIDQTLSAIQCPVEDDDDDDVDEPVAEPVKSKAAGVRTPQSEPSSFACSQCSRKFPTAAMLQEHTDDQHRKKVPQAQDVKPMVPIRPAVAARMMKIKPIRTSLNVRRPYKCPYCPKTFTQKYVMKEHTFIHTGSLRYRCDECMAMFNRPHYLRAHKQKYHGQNSKFKAIKCRFCTRSFVRKQDIKIHERIAHGVVSTGPVEREILMAERNGGEDSGITGTEDNLDEDPDFDDDDDDVDDDDLGEEIDVDDLGEEVDILDGLDGGEEVGDDDEEEGDAESPAEEDPEIRDVVVTLERIPEDVLQTLDNSKEGDEASGDAESASSASQTPRLNVGITLHRCPKCLKVFKTRKSLKHHMIYHQSQLPFACDECGVQFARNRPLQIHKQRYHSEDAPYTGKRFSCDFCPRIFLRERDKLFHHKTVHSMDRNYGNRDESTPELKKAKITKRRDYVCVICCERYETEKACQRHITEFHPSEVPPKTPSPSPAPPTTPVNKLASRKESDEYSTIPLLSTSQSSTFNPSLRPYKLCRCSTCVGIFKTRPHWNEHIQMHPNVRPHHCEQCLFRRKSRSNRKVTSVGFKCQHCPKVFTKASVLRAHQRLHTSELRFPCDDCGMMYDRYRLLQAHKEKYHSEDAMQYPVQATFRCLHCPRTFMRQRDLNFHQESVHAT